MPRILVLTKRQYMNKDLLDDCYGRFREIPLMLARMGHHVEGICLSYKPKKEGKINDGPVMWESINLGATRILGLFRFLKRASHAMRSVDLIWACSDSIYGIFGYILSVKYSKPLIFDLYDNFEYYLAAKLPIIKQLYRYTLKKCAAVTCISQPLADLVLSYDRTSNVLVLENAVREDLFYPMAKSTCRAALGLPGRGIFIGTAGAIHSNRGIGLLFEAFQRLKAEIPDLHLVLAGKWDAGVPRLEDSRIHYLGKLPLESVPFVFNSLDLAVICNRDNDFGRYCFPQKAYEIMACHVPLVAANVGSMAEFFSEDPLHLFQPGNVESLMQSIIFGLQNNLPIRFRQPTWKKMAEKLVAVIQNAIDTNRSRNEPI